MRLFRTAAKLATAAIIHDVSRSASYAIGISADAVDSAENHGAVGGDAGAHVEKAATRPFCQPCPMGKVCLCNPDAGLPTLAAATLLEASSPDKGLVMVTETHVITVNAPSTTSRLAVSSSVPALHSPWSTDTADVTASTSVDDAGSYACSAPNGFIECPFSGFDIPATVLPEQISNSKPHLAQRDDPVNDKNPTSVLASILSASSLWPDGVSPHMTPSASSPLPSDCTDSLEDQFAIQLVFDPSQSPPTKRALSNLGIWLINGTLLDTQSRIGDIVANHQLQFDAFGQAGAIYTSGFSACGPPTARVLALGGNTLFWGCDSGGFANIYNEKVAPQCVAAEIRLINNQNPGTPLLASSQSEQVGAANASPESLANVTFSYSPATTPWANTFVPSTMSAQSTYTNNADNTEPTPNVYWTDAADSVEGRADDNFQGLAAHPTHSIHWMNGAVARDSEHTHTIHWMDKAHVPRSKPTNSIHWVDKADETAPRPTLSIHWMGGAVVRDPSPDPTHSIHWMGNAKRDPGGPDGLADEGVDSDPYPLPTTFVRAFFEQTFTDIAEDGKDTVVTVRAMTKTFVMGPKDESQAASTLSPAEISVLASVIAGLGGSTPTDMAQTKRDVGILPVLPRGSNDTFGANATAAVVTVTELATAYETTTFPLEIVTVTSYPSSGDSTDPSDSTSIPLDLATTVVIVNQTVTAEVADAPQSTDDDFASASAPVLSTNDILPAALTTGGALGVLLNATNSTNASILWSGWTMLPAATTMQSETSDIMTVTSTAVVPNPKTTSRETSTDAEAAASTTLTLGAGAVELLHDHKLVLLVGLLWLWL